MKAQRFTHYGELKHSGRTISEAPFSAASSARLRARERLAALSEPDRNRLLASFSTTHLDGLPVASCISASLRGFFSSAAILTLYGANLLFQIIPPPDSFNGDHIIRLQRWW